MTHRLTIGPGFGVLLGLIGGFMFWTVYYSDLGNNAALLLTLGGGVAGLVLGWANDFLGT